MPAAYTTKETPSRQTAVARDGARRSPVRVRVAVTVSALFLATAMTGFAQQPPTATAPSPTPVTPDCDTSHHREFDFWIGSWRVTEPDGTLAGTNTIRPMLDGCVLFESWTGAQGGRGHSFTLYSRQDGRWHQTWVDNRGSLLQLAGGLVDGEMVLRGSGRARDGAAIEHRITWTPKVDGTVRQHWEVTRDGGATWSTVFDGLYALSPR